MSDIFISYSRKDSEQALQLAERLQGEGMSVWIDQRGIEAAKSWSAEIVDAIEGCRVFLLLLSSTSVNSENVAKELSLAFESKRVLLPVVIEDVPLTRTFKYPLAGVQRVALNHFDAILRALAAYGLERRIEKKRSEERKSLMLLPFEDLSPTNDNGWFTDGIASELIGALSTIRSLRTIDWNTSRIFKDRRIGTIDIARDLNVRYFIEGQVRKFGDQIKIAVTLFDVESGDYLWQDSLKGSMEDVFSIQEQVTSRVIAGLKLHLESAELAKVNDRGTKNAEAYELFLRGHDLAKTLTRGAYIQADKLLEQAIVADPGFAKAWMMRSHVLSLLHSYDRDGSILSTALTCAKEALRLDPQYTQAKCALAAVYQQQRDLDKAERTLLEAAQEDPEDYYVHYMLGQFYSKQARFGQSIPPLERSIELRPEFLGSHWAIVVNQLFLHNRDEAKRRAIAAIPIYEMRQRLAVLNEGQIGRYAALLELAGRDAEALKILDGLTESGALDLHTLYSAACLYARLSKPEQAIDALSRSIRLGFKELHVLQIDPDLASLRELPEFQSLIAQLQPSSIEPADIGSSNA
jgi:adenylate cyclase